MNNSEKLLSLFSENYFFKDLIIDDSHFTPIDSSKRELADLIINLGDIIIAIQLKSRNPKEQTNNISKETQWLLNRCKAAKKQAKDTISFIQSKTLPAFKTKRGNTVMLNANAEIIPLVIFDNPMIFNYEHLLKKHSSSGMEVNCISFLDFKEMCKKLITPMEIVDYLEYRKDIYSNYGDVNIMISYNETSNMLLTEPQKKESLVYNYLIEKYGKMYSIKHFYQLNKFNIFMRELPCHILNNHSDELHNILLLLAHMDREEIVNFMKRLNYTIRKSKRKKIKITGSIRRNDNKYLIIFVSGSTIPLYKLQQMIESDDKIETIMEISIYWISKNQYKIDFLLNI